jgi:hypothetical protein
MSPSNRWKLPNAKVRFSQAVRCARGGEPQEVTLAGFVQRSKKYRGPTIRLPRRIKTPFPDDYRSLFNDDAGEMAPRHQRDF